jgi:hypothetical protein
MTRLEVLGLSATRVDDLEPLVGNSGLDEGDRIDLRGTPAARARGADVSLLEARGVVVLVGEIAAATPPSGAP